MRLPILTALLLAITAAPSKAQWQLQDAHTAADLRGIDSLGGGVAWASGTNGTVLRTEDAGFVWQLCAIPPNAEHLDFRGIQAFDNNTAIVMSSGKGDLSRLYKTTDGCQTWTLLFTNPDKDGFFDALVFTDKFHGWLLGDPVEDHFVLAEVSNSGDGLAVRDLPRPADWQQHHGIQELVADERGAFAASNSSLALPSSLVRPQDPSQPKRTTNCPSADLWFGTSGPGGAKIFSRQINFPGCADVGVLRWVGVDVPLAGTNESSGVFSIAHEVGPRLVAVGGDYKRPDVRQGTAALTNDFGLHWTAANTSPHGYRSAVAYDPTHNTWITVGPNGTDISTDDGRNWHPLKPNPKFGDPPDADQHWNALSLPFVVGPHGRIATLRPNALLTPPPKRP